MILGTCAAHAGVLPTAGKTSATQKEPWSSKWYVDGGLALGMGYGFSEFDARDWCNGAGCVSGYWETFTYPGDKQNKTLGSPATIAATFKLGNQFVEKVAWGIYADVGNISQVMGLYLELGETLLFDFGMGAAYNNLFNNAALDMRFSVGYAYKLNDKLLLIPSVFFGFQMSNDGQAIGEGANCGFTPCWAQGVEMLYYLNGGIRTTLRYNF